LTKAWLSGAEIQEVVIADQLTDQEAYQREIAEIATAPQGQLWNYWSGGEGASRGHRLSAEQRAKIIETNRQTWSDPKLIAEQSKRMKLVWSRPEYRKTFSDAARHKSKAKSDAAKKRWADSEFRAKLGQISVDPLVKQRRSDGAKIGWIKRRSGQIGG
jgi:hypothetical protein